MNLKYQIKLFYSFLNKFVLPALKALKGCINKLNCLNSLLVKNVKYI